MIIKAAEAREALAERAHHQVGMDPAKLRGAAAARAEHADRVRFVDHQARAIRVGQRADLAQRREVAHHRVQAVDHDQHAAVLRGAALELELQVGHVVVPELARVGEAQAAAVDDRRVVLAIAEDDVVLGADRADRAEVGLEAGRHADRGFLAHELREPPLELLVQFERAVEEPRARARRAVLAHGGDRGLAHGRMVREAEVVVATDHDQALAADLDLRAFAALERQEVRVQAHRLEFLGPGEAVALREDVHC